MERESLTLKITLCHTVMWGILVITITSTNKDNDHKNNFKKIFGELAKERFDEIKELIDEINHNDLK